MALKLVLIVLAVSAMALAKPASDQIVFRDEEESDDTLLNLEDENQVFLPAKTRLEGADNEVIAQRLEHGKFFQGDIKLVQDQKEYLLANESDGSVPTRTGWIDEFYRWPKDNRGNVIMPYSIAADSRYSKYQKQLIRVAMDDIQQHTCIKFIERTTQEDYVYIFSGEGCSSHMGKIGDSQELSLDRDGCFARGIIMHELIHALGYDHMHSHADRNKFVDIKWNNIDNDAISNFDTVDPQKFSNFGTTYDLYSVMHYDKKAFSKNDQETIVPRNRRYRNIIGQRIGLSRGDAKRINNMYNCKV